MLQQEVTPDLFLVRTLKALVASRTPFAEGITEWAFHFQDQPSRDKTKQMGELIHRGRMISEALRESNFPASQNVIRLLDGIEKNPEPVVLLQSIEEQLVETEEIRSKLREVIVYPAFLLIGMSLVLLLFSFTLMEAVYDQSWEHQRPLFYWLFSTLHPLRWLLVLLVPLACFAAYRVMKDPTMLPIPGARKVFLNAQRSLFCQFLQLETLNQRAMGESLAAAIAYFPDAYRDELGTAAQLTREGFPLEEDCGDLITSQIRYYLNTAGDKNALSSALGKLRRFYLEQSRIHAAALQNSAEIAGLVVLGILVGLLVAQSYDFYYGYLIGKFPF